MGEDSTALVTPGPKDMDDVKRAGAAMTAYQAEVNAIYRDLHGLEWGSGTRLVKGSSFSAGTRTALAKFCHITGANPMIHVDILGGKPYLNAAFWQDKLTTHLHYHSYTQRDLSASTEEALRERSLRHREVADKMDDGDPEKGKRLGLALDLEDEADDVRLARASWSPRETATVVVETRITRFINAAPMEAIQAGEVQEIGQYLVPVVECNWAGGMGDTLADKKKWDPIGDTHPGTTARTRSLRRTATKSFPAWMDGQQAQIEKAERVIEAEWEVIQQDDEAARAALPAASGPQAVLGMGEPAAGDVADAKELPVVDETPSFDYDEARRRLFATLRDAGITNDRDRKAWSKKNGLDVSTKKWSPEDWERAQELIVAPVRDPVIEAAGDGLGDMSLQVLGKREPEYLKDWMALAAVFAARDGQPQEDLDL